MLNILYALLVVAGVGILAGVLLAVASHCFAVEENETVKITIKDMRGKKYIVRQRMSENQMAENEVGAVLLADDRKEKK